MAEHVPFTDNYQDLSTDRGFQFKFNCERCGNGYMSSYQHNVTGLAGDALRAAGGLFGGILGRAANSTYDIQRMVGGPAHDAALRKAVEEVSPLFIQCRRCGDWVCHEICWNNARNQCVQCSPKMDEEITAIESEATIQQIRAKATDGSVDLTGGVKLNSAVTGAVKLDSASAQEDCPSCGAQVAADAKFCPECGTKIQRKQLCPGCGVEATPGAKFCAECGTKINS